MAQTSTPSPTETPAAAWVQDADAEHVDQIDFPTQPMPSAADSDDSDADAADQPKPSRKRNLAARLLPPVPLWLHRPKTRTKAPTPGETTEINRRTGQDRGAKRRKLPTSIKQVLGYKAMLPSGIAWLGEDEWSITLRVSDINYVSAEESTQEQIIDQWGKFLNGFGGGTRLQISVVNRVLDDEDVAALVQKKLIGDGLDEWREDFNAIVREKLAAQSSNTVTEKYLTITTREPDVEKAEATLSRIGHEVVAKLRGMEDCHAEVLNRTERLRVLSHMLRPHELLAFDEREFNQRPAPENTDTRDVIAPWSIRATTKDGPLVLTSSGQDTYHATLWLRDFPTYLSDRLISELADIKADVTVALHLEPFDQADGTALINRQIAELEMQEIAERRRAMKAGYDADMIPHALKTALHETRGLRDELQESNQKVISSVLLIGISAPTEDQLNQCVKRAQTVVRTQSCVAEVCTYMQHDALTTELPLGLRPIPMRRTLTTGSAAIIVPFTTQECFQPGGNWYGLNANSGNAIVIDRAKGINANGFILGSSGSGKGVAAKHEIQNVLTSRPNDDVIIIDPEHEYEPLVQAFGGTIIRVDATSSERVNPLDIDLGDTLLGDPITRKCVDLLDMLASLIGGARGLDEGQKGIIDRALRTIYVRYAESSKAAAAATYSGQSGVTDPPMPTLNDLRAELENDERAEAKMLADALAIYTEGSLNAFAQQTNVNTHSRLVSWDISLLGSSLMTFGMMVILDQIWKRIAENRTKGKRTWIYIDEFHLMFADAFSTEYFLKIWKRARKWGGTPTGITQNVEELRNNEKAGLMLANSDFLLLLRQHADDADALCELLNLSQQQRTYFTGVAPGSGLIKTGNTVIPLDGSIPTDSKLFRLYETTFEG